MFLENVLVFETDKAKWYTNDMTKSIDEWLCKDSLAEQKGIPSIIFKNFKSYFCELSSGKVYVIIDNKEGSIIHESTSFEALCVYIDMLRFNQRCG